MGNNITAADAIRKPSLDHVKLYIAVFPWQIGLVIDCAERLIVDQPSANFYLNQICNLFRKCFKYIFCL